MKDDTEYENLFRLSILVLVRVWPQFSDSWINGQSFSTKTKSSTQTNVLHTSTLTHFWPRDREPKILTDAYLLANIITCKLCKAFYDLYLVLLQKCSMTENISDMDTIPLNRSRPYATGPEKNLFIYF